MFKKRFNKRAKRRGKKRRTKSLRRYGASRGGIRL